ncbi:MAG: hypothetical protein II460_01945 [Oscillospiraceae bacterium]|jgi:hypothetical protein|nr:hypothetical protein [Oscillospiraceae bacterium]
MKKHEKYNTVKQFACLLLACLLLLPAAAFAEGGGEVAGQLPLAAEPDSGIIDSDALNSWMDGFLKEHDITGNWQDFSVGFCYTGTGDCWYYDADVWMYSASLYKVPVSMLMAEKEAAGELTPESIVMGCTLEYLESTALVYSNNDSGHAMVSFLGGTYNGKCSDMTEKFTDLPAEYFSQDFLDVSYYTARYMTQVMKTLYTGGDAAYPHVIPYLEQAQPNEYFNLNPTLKSYGVAQKYGAFEETYAGKNNNHCAAIIYTPTPIIVVVMTRNIGEYQARIAEVGAYLADYALGLDEKAKEAAAAPDPAPPAAAEPETAPAAAAEPAAPELPADQTGGGEAPAAAPVTASEVPPAEAVVEEEGARRVPTAVIVVGIAVLSAVGGAFTVLSRRNRRQPVRREEQPRRKEEQPPREEEADRYRPRH